MSNVHSRSSGSVNDTDETMDTKRPVRIRGSIKWWGRGALQTFGLRIGTLRRLTWNDVSGSLGDMGTFVPLTVAVSVNNGVDFAATLFFSGVMNVLTGLTFDIPMCVQPMKAIAAIALSSELSVAEIMASGILTSLVVLLLGLTGLIDTFNRLVPMPVVRGLQLGLGVSMVRKGVEYVVAPGNEDSEKALASWPSMVVALIMFSGSFAVDTRRVPLALVYFAAAMAWASWDFSRDATRETRRPSVFEPSTVNIRADDWVSGFLKGALSQIPLTTLNSVIAVCRLSKDLFPEYQTPPRRVAMSVGVMNLVQCWFGGLPMCHGAGGLAGQYRCGARSSASVLLLGLGKIALALAAGDIMLTLLQYVPRCILGVLLGMSGVELSSASRDQNDKTDFFVVAATAGALVGFSGCEPTKTLASALGAATGLCVSAALRAKSRQGAAQGRTSSTT